MPETQSANAAAMPQARHVRTIIVGSGLSGVAVGIKLREAGETDFVILDKADGVGGTWRANTYPGVECDIHAPLYSYSFAPKKDWSKNYGTQPELLSYIEECCTRYGLDAHLQFGQEVTSATWLDAQKIWEVKTSNGHFTANALVSAMGYLSFPNLPELPGYSDFSGPKFHTAQWDHSVDLKGKRVAIVGLGATSIQIIPEIQPTVGQLDIYQRTPAWFMPKHSHELGGFSNWAYRTIPGYHALIRQYHLWAAELVPYQLARPKRTKFMKDIAQKYLDKAVKDPELRAKLQPDYTIGCKRMLFSDTFYDVVQERNVALITNGIKQIEGSAIVTDDGTRRDTDVLVMATGFHTADMPFTKIVKGRSSQRLSEVWQDGRFAYLGSTVPGFPNFFMMLGPNTTVGHTSMTLMIEAQATYIADAIAKMREKGLASVEVRPDVAAEYDARMQDRLAPTVWNAGGCTSYYRGGAGKNTAIWPDTSFKFRRLTKTFDLDKYTTTSS